MERPLSARPVRRPPPPRPAVPGAGAAGSPAGHCAEDVPDEGLTAAVRCDTLPGVGKVLVVLLAAIVIVELLLVLGVAAALFWLGTAQPMLIAAGMLVVTLVAGIVALRAMRPRH